MIAAPNHELSTALGAAIERETGLTDVDPLVTPARQPGFDLQANFATRNFLGEGENFSLGYQRGARTNFFSIAYSDPWFLDTPNSLGVSLYNRETVLPQAFGYEQRSKGGTVAY